MNYLVTANSKILRCGNVEADENSGEWLLSTDMELTNAQIDDLAKVNGLEVEGKKIAERRASFWEALSNSNVPKVSKLMSDENVEIIKAGLEAEKAEDMIIIDLVMSGLSIKAASKAFKEYCTTNGLMISAKERKEAVHKILAEGNFELQTWAQVEDVLEYIQENVNDTNYSQAHSLLRRWAKAEEIDLPKPVKTVGGFKKKMQDWMLSNTSASTKDFKAWLAEAGKDEKAQARLAQTFEFAKKFAGAAAKAAAE